MHEDLNVLFTSCQFTQPCLLKWLPFAGEERGAHALPPLKYDFNALEPHISGMIMEIHHTKHHQGYINNLIAATKKVGI